MLEGPLVKKLIVFSMPLAFTGILQQLFNSADVAVAGRFAGTAALAAVGANVANVSVFVDFLMGFSVGPNVIMARMIGQGDARKAKKAVGTTITLSIIMGLVMMAVGECISTWMLTSAGAPDDVLSQAELYLKIYLISIPFMSVYNCGAALLRSVGDTRRPLYCLIISGAANVGLNILFVAGFGWDVMGVALATVLSNALSCALVIVILKREQGILRLEKKDLIPDRRFIRDILGLGIPAGIQDAVFSISNVFIQSGINSFGSAAIAGSAAALNFEYFSYYMVEGFSQAAVTFTGQNYGAGNIDRCKRVFFLTLGLGALFTEVLALIFVLFRSQLLSIYTADPQAIEFGMVRMLCVVAFEGLVSTFNMPCGSLRGFGYAIIPSVLSLIGTVVLRMLWISTVFAHFGTLSSLLYVYPASWLFTALMTSAALFFALKKAGKRLGAR